MEVELDSMRRAVAQGEPFMETPRPFLLPSPSDQRISTRQIASGDEKRRQKQAEAIALVYNLVNEPWMKYSPLHMVDRGFWPDQFVMAKFQTHVLYFESHRSALLAVSSDQCSLSSR